MSLSAPHLPCHGCKTLTVPGKKKKIWTRLEKTENEHALCLNLALQINLIWWPVGWIHQLSIKTFLDIYMVGILHYCCCTMKICLFNAGFIYMIVRLNGAYIFKHFIFMCANAHFSDKIPYILFNNIYLNSFFKPCQNLSLSCLNVCIYCVSFTLSSSCMKHFEFPC